MISKLKGSITRAISSGTLFFFLVSNSAWGLPAPGISMMPSKETPGFLQIEIPPELASIEETYEAPPKPDPRLILHIQNLHGNESAQTQIKKLLGYLYEKYGFKMLFVEGAVEELNPAYLRLFPDKERNIKLAEALVKQGELTGVEFYLVDGPEDVRAIGIEKADLYRSNYEAFRKVYGAKPETDRFLGDFDAKLERLSSRIFPPETRRILSEWKKFESGHREFLPFVKRLAQDSKRVLGLDLESLFAQVEWPQITRLLVIQSMEKDMNREAAMAERARLTEFLKSKKISFEIITAIEKLGDKKITMTRKDDPREKLENLPRYLFERLVEEAGPKGFYFHDYPAFSLWAGHLILESELDSKSLFDEIQRVFEKILIDLAGTEAQKNLLELYQDGELLRKLYALEVSRKEWERVLYRREWIRPEVMGERLGKIASSFPHDFGRESNSGSPAKTSGDDRPLSSIFSTALEFYDLARKRDDIFYETIQREMDKNKTEKAVLVTGGFHTDGIMEKLREREINYSVLMPQITGDLGNSHYISSMMESKQTMFNLATLEKPLMGQDSVSLDRQLEGLGNRVVRLWLQRQIDWTQQGFYDKGTRDQRVPPSDADSLIRQWNESQRGQKGFRLERVEIPTEQGNRSFALYLEKGIAAKDPKGNLLGIEIKSVKAKNGNAQEMLLPSVRRLSRNELPPALRQRLESLPLPLRSEARAEETKWDDFLKLADQDMPGLGRRIPPNGITLSFKQLRDLIAKTPDPGLKDSKGNAVAVPKSLRVFLGGLDAFLAFEAPDGSDNISIKLFYKNEAGDWVRKESFIKQKEGVVAGRNPIKENWKEEPAKIPWNKDWERFTVEGAQRGMTSSVHLLALNNENQTLVIRDLASTNGSFVGAVTFGLPQPKKAEEVVPSFPVLSLENVFRNPPAGPGVQIQKQNRLELDLEQLLRFQGLGGSGLIAGPDGKPYLNEKGEPLVFRGPIFYLGSGKVALTAEIVNKNQLQLKSWEVREGGLLHSVDVFAPLSESEIIFFGRGASPSADPQVTAQFKGISSLGQPLKVLDQSFLSRTHAALVWEAAKGRLTLIDVSTNGTFMNLDQVSQLRQRQETLANTRTVQSPGLSMMSLSAGNEPRAFVLTGSQFSKSKDLGDGKVTSVEIPDLFEFQAGKRRVQLVRTGEKESPAIEAREDIHFRVRVQAEESVETAAGSILNYAPYQDIGSIKVAVSRSNGGPAVAEPGGLQIVDTLEDPRYPDYLKTKLLQWYADNAAGQEFSSTNPKIRLMSLDEAATAVKDIFENVLLAGLPADYSKAEAVKKDVQSHLDRINRHQGAGKDSALLDSALDSAEKYLSKIANDKDLLAVLFPPKSVEVAYPAPDLPGLRKIDPSKPKIVVGQLYTGLKLTGVAVEFGAFLKRSETPKALAESLNQLFGPQYLNMGIHVTADEKKQTVMIPGKDRLFEIKYQDAGALHEVLQNIMSEAVRSEARSQLDNSYFHEDNVQRGFEDLDLMYGGRISEAFKRISASNAAGKTLRVLVLFARRGKISYDILKMFEGLKQRVELYSLNKEPADKMLNTPESLQAQLEKENKAISLEDARLAVSQINEGYIQWDLENGLEGGVQELLQKGKFDMVIAGQAGMEYVYPPQARITILEDMKKILVPGGEYFSDVHILSIKEDGKRKDEKDFFQSLDNDEYAVYGLKNTDYRFYPLLHVKNLNPENTRIPLVWDDSSKAFLEIEKINAPEYEKSFQPGGDLKEFFEGEKAKIRESFKASNGKDSYARTGEALSRLYAFVFTQALSEVLETDDISNVEFLKNYLALIAGSVARKEPVFNSDLDYLILSVSPADAEKAKKLTASLNLRLRQLGIDTESVVKDQFGLFDVESVKNTIQTDFRDIQVWVEGLDRFEKQEGAKTILPRELILDGVFAGGNPLAYQELKRSGLSAFTRLADQLKEQAILNKIFDVGPGIQEINKLEDFKELIEPFLIFQEWIRAQTNDTRFAGFAEVLKDYPAGGDSAEKENILRAYEALMVFRAEVLPDKIYALAPISGEIFERMAAAAKIQEKDNIPGRLNYLIAQALLGMGKTMGVIRSEARAAGFDPGTLEEQLLRLTGPHPVEKALVVAGNGAIRETLAPLLSALLKNATVFQAGSLSEAVEILRKEKIDLYFVDGKNGIQLAEMVRTASSGIQPANTPVVIFSGDVGRLQVTPEQAKFENIIYMQTGFGRKKINQILGKVQGKAVEPIEMPVEQSPHFWTGESAHASIFHMMLLQALQELIGAQKVRALKETDRWLQEHKIKLLNIGVETLTFESDRFTKDNLVTVLRAKGIEAIGLDPRAADSGYYRKGAFQKIPDDLKNNSFDIIAIPGLLKPEYMDLQAIEAQGFDSFDDFYKAGAVEIHAALKPDGFVLVDMGAYVTKDQVDALTQAFKASGFEWSALDSKNRTYLFKKQLSETVSRSEKPGKAIVEEGPKSEVRTSEKDQEPIAIRLGLPPGFVGVALGLGLLLPTGASASEITAVLAGGLFSIPTDAAQMLPNSPLIDSLSRIAAASLPTARGITVDPAVLQNYPQLAVSDKPGLVSFITARPATRSELSDISTLLLANTNQYFVLGIPEASITPVLAAEMQKAVQEIFGPFQDTIGDRFRFVMIKNSRSLTDIPRTVLASMKKRGIDAFLKVSDLQKNGYVQWIENDAKRHFEAGFEDLYAKIMASRLEDYPRNYTELFIFGIAGAAKISQGLEAQKLDEKTAEALAQRDKQIEFRVTSSLLAFLGGFIQALRSVATSA